MENNNKMRDLYELCLELGHDVFEERIKKPMELYMHANGNVISMNALNTIVANAMENSKLGEAGFDEHDIFSPPSFEQKIFFDDTLPPIYDDYNDSGILVPPTMEDKVYYDYIKSYSPYDNVEPKKYPHILITAGLNDSRVKYWEPAKWTAALRTNKTDSNVLLLKTNMGAGHGGVSGRYGKLEEIAFEYAFLLDCLGLAEVQLTSSKEV